MYFLIWTIIYKTADGIKIIKNRDAYLNACLNNDSSNEIVEDLSNEIVELNINLPKSKIENAVNKTKIINDIFWINDIILFDTLLFIIVIKQNKNDNAIVICLLLIDFKNIGKFKNPLTVNS